MSAAAWGCVRRRSAGAACPAAIAIGHAASIALVACVVAQGMSMDRPLFQGLAGALLVGAASYRLLRGAGQCTSVGTQAGHAGIALWSFLMATAHGAGLMLVPALVPLCLADCPARDHASARCSWPLPRRVHTARPSRPRSPPVAEASPCTLACRAAWPRARPGPRRSPSRRAVDGSLVPASACSKLQIFGRAGQDESEHWVEAACDLEWTERPRACQGSRQHCRVTQMQSSCSTLRYFEVGTIARYHLPRFEEDVSCFSCSSASPSRGPHVNNSWMGCRTD